MLPSRTGPRKASRGTTATPGSAGRTMPRPLLAAARNIAKVALLLGGFAAAFTVLGWWLGGARAGGVLLVVALLSSGMLVYSGDRVILGMLGARELLPAGAPAFASMVKRLARRVGTGAVKLAVIDDSHPRALAVGRTPNRSTLVVSRGLLSMAAPAELEGVVAHELAHVRSWDVLVQTVTVVITGAILEMSRFGLVFQQVLLVVLGPLAASLANLMLSPRRDLAADAAAAAACESPAAVADSLLHLDHSSELVNFEANPATEPLYTINPFADEGIAAMFSTHPPLAERVRLLRAMDDEAQATSGQDSAQP